MPETMFIRPDGLYVGRFRLAEIERGTDEALTDFSKHALVRVIRSARAAGAIIQYESDEQEAEIREVLLAAQAERVQNRGRVWTEAERAARRAERQAEQRARE